MACRLKSAAGTVFLAGWLLAVLIISSGCFPMATKKVKSSAAAESAPTQAPAPSASKDETANTTADEGEPASAAGGENSGWYDGKTFEGVASWYGKKFHGKKTANGEIFDMNGYTAAHRTMPLGSRIRVTNLDNGHTRELVVNDRGPYAEGRILDISYAAAKNLGYARTGTARVKAEVLEVGENRYKGGGIMPLPAEDPFSADGGEGASEAGAEVVPERKPRLLLGTFDARWKADRLYYYLRGRFRTIRVDGGGGEYKVYIGPFTSEKVRGRIYNRLKMEGFDVELE